MTHELINATEKTLHPEDVKRSLQYSHVPCKEIIQLKNEVHSIKEEVPPNLTELRTNQEDIKTTLNTINGSLDRIFYLYKKADKRLDINDERLEEIKIYMAKKDTSNGHSEKDVEHNKHDIEELTKSRQPILERLSIVEKTKAEKEDVNKVLVAVERMEGTLDNHCQNDKALETQKGYQLDRKDKYILAILGIIVTVCIFIAGVVLT